MPMNNTERQSSAYTKKIIFARLLAGEVGDSPLSINASFRWEQPSKICSFKLQDGVVRPEINLNICGLSLPSSRRLREETDILFRVFFIAAYIRLTEAAAGLSPCSYFEGLALLQVICAMGGKATAVFSPLVKSPSHLTAAEAYCAVYALKRLLAAEDGALSEKEREYCRERLSMLEAYSRLPEAEYRRGKSVFALKVTLKTLRENIRSGQTETADFALFSDNGMCGFQELTLKQLAEKCRLCPSPFWAGLVVRLYALSGEKYPFPEEREGSICAALEELRSECLRYAREQSGVRDGLLAHNLQAVRQIAWGAERAFGGMPGRIGMHYIR